MVIKKCVKCKKNITKKVPGLECSRCDKIVHADPTCSKLSNKQLNTIRNSAGIEWSCEDCLKNMSRRSSFIIPEDDGDNDDCEDAYIGNQVIDAKKLVHDISREVKKAFREEMVNLEGSIEFLSEQLTTMEKSLDRQESKIKDLENKNQELCNKNKNLELRVTVLEQNLKGFEQKSLTTSLEIAGLPEVPPHEVSKLVGSVATKLHVNEEDILLSQRLPGNKDKPGYILVEMKSKAFQQRWIEAAKKTYITVGDVLPDITKEKADGRVFIREALTKCMKTLLFNAKTRLLNKYCQFVWCKNGKVCARKTGNSRIHYIRTINDINQIEKEYSLLSQQKTKESQL